MLALLITLSLLACDGGADGKSGTPTAAAKVSAPPLSLSSVRYGGSFVRCCWFATFTDEQQKALGDLASAAGPKEAVAKTAAAAALLDATQAVADAAPAEGLQALADALAAAERANLDQHVLTLDALIATLGKEQLDAGGSQAATKALIGVITTNPWLAENNPFEHTPPTVSEEEALGKMVSAKLSVARSYLTFQGISATAAARVASLDVSSADWATAYSGTRTEIFDAWQAHRAATVAAYLNWATTMPTVQRQRLVLESGVQAALNLPPTDEPKESGMGGGMAGSGMGGTGGMGGGAGMGQGGMGQGGQGSTGMGQGGMGQGGQGSMGGEQGGMGGQQGGMGGQQGGMGGQQGGMGGQQGGMGGQQGGMGAGQPGAEGQQGGGGSPPPKQ